MPPSQGAQAHLTADRAPHRLSGTRRSAQARNISVFLPSVPHPTPPFPFKKTAPGRADPVRRPKAAHRRRSFYSREIMYHPSRGAARRLGPCLRAYQARPQVRAQGKRGRGETLLGAGAWGGARAPFRAGAVTSHRPCPLVPNGALEGPGLPEHWGAAASRGAHGTSFVLGLGCRAPGRIRTSSASPRLPVPGGDLKGRGRRGSEPGCGANPEIPSPDQTDLRAHCAARAS